MEVVENKGEIPTRKCSLPLAAAIQSLSRLISYARQNCRELFRVGVTSSLDNFSENLLISVKVAEMLYKMSLYMFPKFHNLHFYFSKYI